MTAGSAGDRWQVSGDAAGKYERFVAAWFVPWAADLVERAGIGPGDHVLDVAGGTGVVARAAGPVLGPSGSIVVTDLNPDMLAEAQRHPVAGAPATWQPADATDLPFDSGRFDAVLCQQGLQFVPDKAAAAAEMRRVLRPGGVAAVSVWRGAAHNPYLSALAEGLGRHLSADAAKVMLAPCGFGDRDALAAVFTDAGFASVAVHTVTLEREPVDPHDAVAGNLAALPIAATIAEMDPDARDALVDDIVERLGPHIGGGGLTAPSSAHVAIAVA